MSIATMTEMDVETSWDIEDGEPVIYLEFADYQSRFTTGQAMALARAIDACISGIRWHRASWVQIRCSGRTHLIRKADYSPSVRTMKSVCGRRDEFYTWDSSPVSGIGPYDRERICKRCLRTYDQAQD